MTLRAAPEILPLEFDAGMLARAFGISGRLATRIGALAAHGLHLSATAAEVAGASDEEGRRLREFLLAPTTLARAKAAETLLADSPPGITIVIAARDLPVLCLDEELLAAQAESRAARASEPLPAPGDVLARSPLATVAAPAGRDEIARYLTTVRTSRDLAAKIEAWQQLTLPGRLAPEAQSAVIIEGLASTHAEFAREVTAQLGAVGVARGEVAALLDLHDRSASVRAHALDRLRQAVAAADAQPLLLAAGLLTARRLLEDGASDPDLKLTRDLVLFLGEATRGAVATAANIEEVVRTLVKVSLRAPVESALSIRRAIWRLYAAAPRETVNALFAEDAAISDHALAVYVLALLGEAPLEELDAAAGDSSSDPASLTARAARLLVERALAASGPLNHAQLAAGLRRRGALALELMLEVLDRARAEDRADVIATLDRMAHQEGMPDSARRAARARLIALLPAVAPDARLAILESRLLARAELTQSEARTIAREIVARIELHLLADIWKSTLELANRLGGVMLKEVERALDAAAIAPDLVGRAIELAGASVGTAAMAEAAASAERAIAQAEQRGGAKRGGSKRTSAKREAKGGVKRSGAPRKNRRDAKSGAEHGNENANATLREDAIAALEFLFAIARARPEHALTAAAAAGAVLSGHAIDESSLCEWLARYEEAAAGGEPEHDAALDVVLAAIALRADLSPRLRRIAAKRFHQALAEEARAGAPELIEVRAAERPWTGKVYVATGSDLLFTARMPAAITGLAALADNSSSGAAARAAYLELEAIWEHGRSEDAGWDPWMVAMVVGALARLAAGKRATAGIRQRFLERFCTREDILHPDGDSFPVLEALPAIFAALPRPIFSKRATECIALLLDLREELPGLLDEHRLKIAVAIAAMAASPRLAGVKALRLGNRLANLALVALRAGAPGARAIAESLQESPLLGADRKEEVRLRLDSYQGDRPARI